MSQILDGCNLVLVPKSPYRDLNYGSALRNLGYSTHTQPDDDSSTGPEEYIHMHTKLVMSWKGFNSIRTMQH